MVDERTLDYYDEHAQAVFDRFISVDRSDFHNRIEPYLVQGGLSADIGCGSGADLSWLNSIGCPAIGYEPSSRLRRLAMHRFVDLDIRSDFLPDLTSIRDGLFQNVLCHAVLMHLPDNSLALAVTNLSRILAPGGRLIASWRATTDGSLREENGRLFNPISNERMTKLATDAGLTCTANWTYPDATRPGIIWNNYIGEKTQTES